MAFERNSLPANETQRPTYTSDSRAKSQDILIKQFLTTTSDCEHINRKGYEHFRKENMTRRAENEAFYPYYTRSVSFSGENFTQAQIHHS